MTLAFEPPRIADSAFARLDPRWKLATTILAIAGLAAIREPLTACAGFVIVLLLAAIARLPLRWFARRLGALALALAPFVIVMPLVQGIGGLRLATLLAAKAGSIVTLALILLGTTSLPLTLHAARALHVPTTLVQILALSYRYIFLLADESNRLWTALRIRGFRAGTNRRTYRTIGHVVGTLIVQSSERAVSVSQAMRCRGFDGQFRSLTVFRTSIADVAYLVVMVGTAAGLAAWDYLSTS